MINQKTAEEVLGILSGSGAEFCEIFAAHTTSNSVFMEGSNIERISAGEDSGVGLRILEGDTTAYAYVNSFDKKRIIQIARELSTVKKGQKQQKDIELSGIKESDNSYIKIYPDTVSLDRKVALLTTMDKTARDVSGQVSQVSARYADTHQDVYIANTLGTSVKDTRVRSRLMINVISSKDGVIQTGLEAPGEARGWDYIEQLDIKKLARAAAERSVRMLDARPAPAGRMPVVLSGQAGGTMVHEACGHSLEADFLYKQTSVFTGRLGEQVASPLVTVIDDGSLAYNYGYLNVDDEGTPTRENVLIDKGILKGLLTDRLNAGMLGIPLSGNGRRQSYRNKPVPRMTNTYIAKGDKDPEEIISSVDEGLFVVKMGGGQVNTTNGDFVFEVSEGYLIKNGKITQPVRGATLTGNGPEVLRSVDMVGNDLSFIPGVCGKGDRAPVSDGQPTIRIPQILVGGLS